MARTLDHQIKTKESLFQHLQWAMEVEHFTIPPYLTALYSIPEGKNQKAASLIRSVVMEEMLHMVLVANLMNAVGISPIMDTSSFIPKYPQSMPHSGDHFKVSLEKFSKKALKTFMQIESPTQYGDPVNPDHYHSIGELYDAISQGFNNLKNENLFIGKKENQISATHYYGGGGKVLEVYNLKTALAAIEEIKEQGEGFIAKPNDPGSIFDGDEKEHGQEPEVAHYYRFLEIVEQRSFDINDNPKTGPTGKRFSVDWRSVYPMTKNPKVLKFKDNLDIVSVMHDFNRTYTLMLRKLQHAFSGNPDSLAEAVTIMYKLKYKAVDLMRTPSGKGKRTVGPSFEYYQTI